jgi:hypothetical protein
MRRTLFVGLLALPAAIIPATGKAQSWCIRDAGGVTADICAFNSADDCIRAALVGPSGGLICSQQHRIPTAEAATVQQYASPLRPKRKRIARRTYPWRSQ